MGWFTRLAKKAVGGIADLGKKAVGAVGSGLKAVGSAARVGVKWAYDHAEKIGDIAGKVEKVAGIVGKAATSAIPWTAEIPIIGEIVAGTAGAAKVVQGGAGAVARVAGRVGKVKKVVEGVQQQIAGIQK